MNEESEGIFSCKGICWMVGALLGFTAYLIMRGRYEAGFVIALIVGLVIVIGVALALRMYFCAEVEETEGGFAAMSAQRAADRKQFEADRAEAKAEAAAAKEAAAEQKAQADGAAAAPETAEAEKAPEAGEKAEEAASQEPAREESAGKEAAKAEAAAKPAGEAARPEGLAAAREGGADDLKLIKGVGPKLEALLNSLGIYHFDQIAAWSDREVAWMDDNLKGFKGRVSRDEWIRQAKVLAEGGTTEFANKVKKGDVY